MYERSAIILERYFAQKFYYIDKNNLKNNYENYRHLIDVLEKYQEVAEAEDKIITECEEIARRIKRIQKDQNTVYNKALKLYEHRNSIFENIDEPANDLSKQLDKVGNEIEKNNSKMRPIDEEFVKTISEFNEKSEIRFEYGKKRRKVEKEYRTVLENTVTNIGKIDTEKIMEIKQFIMSNESKTMEELKDEMLKNGEKEKIPFDKDVIEKAIEFGQKLHKQEVMLLLEIYEKTNSLIDEVNDNIVKIKKYKKLSKDTKNKLIFINVQKEYLIEFLDNERQSVGLGKKEHKKLMKEACNDFQQDVEQINNLNKLLTEQINNKATQTMYKKLYSVEYLQDLIKKERDFENKLSELNLVGKILNPIYWRITSIEKVYTTFNEIVEEEYEKDMSGFKLKEEDFEEELPKEESNEKNKKLKVTSMSKKKEENEYDKENKENEYDKFMSYYDNLTSDEDESENDVKDDDENDDDDEQEDGLFISYEDDEEFEEDNDNYDDEFDDENDDDDIYDYEDDDEDDYDEADEEDSDDDYDEADEEDSDDDYEDDIKFKKGRTNKKKGLFGFKSK